MLDFPGYNHYPAQPTDEYRAKWGMVRATIGAGVLPALNGPVSLGSVAGLNLMVNRSVHYQAELPGQDNWQSAGLTWTSKAGDCEDYAILKYAALLRSGVSEDMLGLHIGEIRKLGMGNLDGNRPHAWLAACISGKWYAVDQMFDHLIPVGEYINWTPKATCTGSFVFRYGQAFTLAEKMKPNA